MTAPVGTVIGASWAFSAEELRVLAAVSGATLPPTLADDDTALAGAVATRSLVAHGLLILADDAPMALAPGAANRLRPLLEADTAAEIELDVRPIRRHVVLGRPGATKLVLREREPEVWVVDRTDDSLEDVLWRLLEEHAPAGPEPTGIRLEIPLATARDVGRLAVAGDWEAVDDGLRQADVPAGPAAIWRAALAGVRQAGRMRLSHRVDDEFRLGGEVRWWDAGDRGVWRIVTPRDCGRVDGTSEPRTVIEDVGGAAIVSDLSELIGAEEAALRRRP